VTHHPPGLPIDQLTLSQCRSRKTTSERQVSIMRRLSAVLLNTFAAHSNNLKLAQRMYQARVLELKELILSEEARFKFVSVMDSHSHSLLISLLLVLSPQK
jgi:hypothetical protein